jgi:hypothetical protein
MLIRFFVLSFFIWVNSIFLSTAYGQIKIFDNNNLFIEAAYHYGYIMPHHPQIEYLLQDHLQAFQISVGTNNLDNKYWQLKHNFPRTGFGIYHSNLGNDKVFGSMTAFFVSFEKSFFNQNWPINFSNNIQVGPCYVSKYFNMQDDYFNNVMGSHLNIYLNYSLCMTIPVGKLLRLKFGAGYSHISNGDLAEPNLGLNMCTFRTGLILLPFKPVYNYQAVVEKEELKKNHLMLVPSIGMKQMSRFDKNDYWVYGFTVDYCRMVTPMNGFGAGADIYYDFATPVIRESENKPPPTQFQMFHYTAHATWQNQLGRFIFVVQPGIYLYKSFSKYGTMSNKAGFRYQLTDKLICSVLIKGHWLANADVIEWGMGYDF